MDAPAWLDELAFPSDGPPWLAMGLARCDESRWLVPDEHRTEQLAEREHLLDDRHEEVFAARPGTEAAGAETLELVVAWMEAHGLGACVDAPAGRHPLESAGRLVQEDLCLMVERDGQFHLDAACLCFPSHWRLADKIGGSSAAIHGPVPGFADELDEKVDRYLHRLRPDVIGVRRNWSVHRTADLFAPGRPRATPLAADGLTAAGPWLRSERQTLRRLPRTGAVLFTIRVQQAPLVVLAHRPDVAAAFAMRLRAQPAALTAMNGLDDDRDVVLAWIDSVALDA